ncbi:MAG TPA: ankyrin repeat domain-containing protein [Gammaproteobacteria bacterium]|nr:ankyrin repeat domain-containing protein [Gammaproteobacteria bacterium]
MQEEPFLPVDALKIIECYTQKLAPKGGLTEAQLPDAMWAMLLREMLRNPSILNWNKFQQFKREHEHQLSEASHELYQRCLLYVMRSFLSVMTPENQCLEMEWASLLLQAMKNPTADNVNQVDEFKQKHENNFTPTCIEFYEASQPYLASIVNAVPPEVYVVVMRNLDTRAVGYLSATRKSMTQFFDDTGEWQRRFKAVFPREYEVLMEKRREIYWHSQFIFSIKKLQLTADQLALLMAVADKDSRALEVLLAEWPMENYYNPWGIALLTCASLNNFEEGVVQLWNMISGRPDVSVNELFILAICARRPIEEIIAYINLGANIVLHVLSVRGMSPFLLACECNYVECAQVLLNRTAPWHSTDLIEAAAAQGNFRAVKRLVETKRISSESSGQAAFQAYARGYESIAEYLLENGANTDAFLKMMDEQIKKAKEAQGNTPFSFQFFDSKEKLGAFYYMKLALDNPTERNLDALREWEQALSAEPFSKVYQACKFLLKGNREFLDICRRGSPEQIRDLILYKNRDIFLLNDATQKTVLEKLVMLKDRTLVEKILEAYIKDNALFKSSIEFLWASTLLKGIREPSAENNQQLDTLRSIKQYQNMFVLRMCPQLYDLCKPFLAPVAEPARRLSR